MKRLLTLTLCLGLLAGCRTPNPNPPAPGADSILNLPVGQ